MLQNAYFLAKIGADTAENEQHFAEICRDRDADALTDADAVAGPFESGLGGGSVLTLSGQGLFAPDPCAVVPRL